ncbi:hypothetical protein G7046_g3805 [Stylonectria norvegica]|nr:hypothetical protein G7046_g3805 [Stylonectria norvegica]
MSASTSPLASVPNEILIHILRDFTTKELIPLVSINHLFHSLITRIVQCRVLQTASLPDNKLILECYHPSAKWYTPYLGCQYQKIVTRDGPPLSDSPSLSDLWRLYASFHPTLAAENRRPRRIRARFVAPQLPNDSMEDTATQAIELDEDELFSQLCAVINVVSEDGLGLFVSHVNVVEGVMRIFRYWLADMATKAGSGKESEEASAEERIVWVDAAKTVGIRFRIVPAASETMPLVSGPNDDPPVSYTLVYEELLVRASKLLLAAEMSVVQQIADAGNSLIIRGL